MMRTAALKIALVAFLSVSIFGCTFIFQTGRRSDVQKIDELNKQLEELMSAKGLLEQRLSQEIKDKQVKLEMMDKGLVITFVADVLFDSGKAKLRSEAFDSLTKVGRVLDENVPQLNVGIEGHTDNVPIKVSGWKSNWQLSTERALSVLDYLVSEKGLVPDRFSAIGYGEYRPVASNDSAAGRKLNRRVEVVILPQMTKAHNGKQPKAREMSEPEENLK